MGIELGSQFDVKTGLALDSRLKVADLTERDQILSGVRYEGMIVYVVSEQTNFQLIGGIDDANWAELSGGGGGGAVVVSVTQSVPVGGTITLTADTQRERVKVAGSLAAVNALLPNGTIDGQEVYLQGASNNYPVTILNGGNVRSNGDITLYAGSLIGYMWDQSNGTWYQIGGI